ncbi:MAG: DUF779 domain-containing protein [Myxococcales bacterium]|nr:DUF779 domain-containing protein [Myxococcales bacterium]
MIGGQALPLQAIDITSVISPTAHFARTSAFRTSVLRGWCEFVRHFKWLRPRSLSPSWRVAVTDAALALVRRLAAAHGPLMFHLSGGCCDGSAPMCFAAGEFRLGERDVKLGEVDGHGFWIGGEQWARWDHTAITLDVVPGRGASFSLEIPEGVRFVIRSAVCARP